MNHSKITPKTWHEESYFASYLGAIKIFLLTFNTQKMIAYLAQKDLQFTNFIDESQKISSCNFIGNHIDGPFITHFSTPTSKLHIMCANARALHAVPNTITSLQRLPSPLGSWNYLCIILNVSAISHDIWYIENVIINFKL